MLSLLLAGLSLIGLLYCDLRHRRLPNRLVAAYAALCPLALFVVGVPPSTWLQHIVVAMLTFLIFTTMFTLGGMGGGDVKLGTAVLGWAGVQSLVPCLLVIAVSGLVLAALGVLADMLIARQGPMASDNDGVWRILLHALSAKRGVPYGVALAFGGMVVLPAYW